MKKIIFPILIFTIFSTIKGQVYLNTPLEILTFMEASPTKYEFEQLYGEAPPKKRPVIPHGTYIESINNREHQRQYKNQETPEVSRWKNKARTMLGTEGPNYKKVRIFYNKCLKKNPQNAQLHTFKGETYYEEGRYEEAMECLQKAIELNPIDYLAHWQMAEIFLKKNEIERALHTITIAHIYNRNHPRLLKRMIDIYKKHDKIYYRNWGFDPKMYLYQDGNKVVIAADGIWLTYGMYKAVWNFDSDYKFIKEQQEVTDHMFQMEMEATIGTFMTHNSLKKDDKRNYPTMEAFGKCLDNEMVEEFVMYEILIVDKPTIAYHMTTDFMNRLIEYIKKIRSVDYTRH